MHCIDSEIRVIVSGIILDKGIKHCKFNDDTIIFYHFDCNVYPDLEKLKCRRIAYQADQ